jgi:hypothetical protein
VGRSFADFLLLGRTKEWVVAVASGVATELGMHVEMTSPNQIKARRGSIWWTGTRNFIVVAQDAPGGASVHIEAWAGGLAEFSADPASIFGFLPRRDAWRVASTLASRLGAIPEQVFRHS